MRILPSAPTRSTNAAVLASLALALAICAFYFATGDASAQGPALSFDAGLDGNQATSLGPIENCVAVHTNDQFQMDIVVQDVSDLLAWQMYVDYNPAVVSVVSQDVKLFQQANAGSSVLDLSGAVPDDSGLHSLAAFDSSDPPTPDSGSGVLARVTFLARGPGSSPIRFGHRDGDSDGKLDKGTLLRDSSAALMGDTNDDTFFDGTETDAQVVVDGACPPGSVVATATLANPGGSSTGSDSSFPWAIVGGAVAAAVIVLGAIGALLLTRRRSTARRTLPDETSSPLP